MLQLYASLISQLSPGQLRQRPGSRSTACSYIPLGTNYPVRAPGRSLHNGVYMQSPGGESPFCPVALRFMGTLLQYSYSDCYYCTVLQYIVAYR